MSEDICVGLDGAGRRPCARAVNRAPLGVEYDERLQLRHVFLPSLQLLKPGFGRHERPEVVWGVDSPFGNLIPNGLYNQIDHLQRSCGLFGQNEAHFGLIALIFGDLGLA